MFPQMICLRRIPFPFLVLPITEVEGEFLRDVILKEERVRRRQE